MARFEVEVEDWQAEVFRKHVGAFLNARIVADELVVTEAKAHKEQTLKARLDLLKEPIPEELMNPVKAAYGTLFEKVLEGKQDITPHIDTLEELNSLQIHVYHLFDESRHRRWLDYQSGAVVIERFGLKTGQQRTYLDLAPDLLMSPARANQLSSQAVKSLRRPFSSPLFVPQFVTFKD